MACRVFRAVVAASVVRYVKGVYMCIRIMILMCMRIYIYIIHIVLYIYIYVYVHIYIYIYVAMYLENFDSPSSDTSSAAVRTPER